MSALLTACSTDQQEATGLVSTDERMRVEFHLPGAYVPATPDVRTKADNLYDEVGAWNDLPDLNATLLSPGSTLWLSYAKLANDGTPAAEPQLQGYVVGTMAGGYNQLYPCATTTDADGKLRLDTEQLGAPLYLEAGTYKFKMISPAYPIATDLTMQVDNGMYLYSTDGRYAETAALETEIEINTQGVQYILLPPMIAQVARFNFLIERGEGVYTLEPLEAGIEISGLQNPYHRTPEGGTQLMYNWSSEDIADTLVMRPGDKRAWVTLPGEDMLTDEETGTVSGDIGVLPTVALSNSICVLLNMAVNGVPTQYMTLLNGMELVHAHSYNLKWKVSVEEGEINVVTWQNQSWTTDVEGNE